MASPYPDSVPFKKRTMHRMWLTQRAEDLFELFHSSTLYTKGGFLSLTAEGKPISPDNPERGIHSTCRMIHCFALGSLMGRPGSDHVVDHGMRFLWEHHRDTINGGYFWSVDNKGPVDSSKQGYGHAFVLLAASSAKMVGHPDADRLLADVTDVLQKYFWEEKYGAIAEEFHADWSPMPTYRGQNSNMHLTEALMAAYEATGSELYLSWAQRVADLIINRHARANDFRVAEHFTDEWVVDRAYDGHEMFRPAGTTPGHSLEWSRLLMQLWVLSGRRHAWMPEAAQALFKNSIDFGWDQKHGGFFYTLDWKNAPARRYKLWWPVAEAIGAASFLMDLQPDPYYEMWYRRLWETVTAHFLDRQYGGWIEQLNEQMEPQFSLFPGKCDIYHALQACLIPLFPSEGSLSRVIHAQDALF